MQNDTKCHYGIAGLYEWRNHFHAKLEVFTRLQIPAEIWLRQVSSPAGYWGLFKVFAQALCSCAEEK